MIKSYARLLAEWLVRLEIIILSVIYLVFVITDQVPPVAFALIGLVWIARWWTAGRCTRATPLDLPILILVGLLPISFSASISAWQSLPKVYGLILGAAFFYALVNAVRTRRDLAWAALWLVMLGAALSAAGLVGTDWVQGRLVSTAFIYDHLPRFVQGLPRSIAGGFARNGVAGTLTFIVPMLVGFAVYSHSVFAATLAHPSSGEASVENIPNKSGRLDWRFLRWLGDSKIMDFWMSRLVIAVLALASATLVLTQSRGGILGAGIGILAVVIWRDRRFAWLGIAGATILLVLVALGYASPLLNFLFQLDVRNGTLASRMEVWQRGVMMVRDFPFTGIGIGTYNSVAHLLYPFFIAATDEVVAHAHNNILEAAVDLGIPGMVAYVALLAGFTGCAVRAYRSDPDPGARTMLVGLGSGMLAHQIFGLTDAFILGTKPGVVMWIFLALVATLDGRRLERRQGIGGL